MLRADFTVRYCHEILKSYGRQDLSAKIFLAATSSSTVATWGIWAEVSWLWKSLSAGSALIAVALPILNWNKKMVEIADVHGTWVQIRNHYDSLWRQMQNNQFTDAQAEAAYETIKQKEADAEIFEARILIFKKGNAKLLEKCYREVLRSRNLSLT